jgi:hypothetical protein
MGRLAQRLTQIVIYSVTDELLALDEHCRMLDEEIEWGLHFVPSLMHEPQGA